MPNLLDFEEQELMFEMNLRLQEKIKYYEEQLEEVNWLYNFYIKEQKENHVLSIKKQKDEIESTLRLLKYIAKGDE